MKEDLRKCLKCGRSPAADANVKLYRFPQPGKSNTVRCETWAKYCFPDKECSTEFQRKLYSGHKMLCERHFKESSFIDFIKKTLHRYAVPVDVKTVQDPAELYVHHTSADSDGEEILELHHETNQISDRSDVADDSLYNLTAHDCTQDQQEGSFSWHNLEAVVPCDDTECEMEDELEQQMFGTGEAPKPADEPGEDAAPLNLLHEGYQCNICGSDIVGFRYVCVQCADCDICSACEARQAHRDHYVLRVPGPRPHGEVAARLQTIRRALLVDGFVHLDSHLQEPEVKDEPTEADPMDVEPVHIQPDTDHHTDTRSLSEAECVLSSSDDDSTHSAPTSNQVDIIPAAPLKRLHTGEVKQRLHTGEVKQRLHTGEVKQRHHTGEVKQRLHTGEVKQRLHTGEVKQRLQTGEVKQRLQTGEVKQRLHTGEVKQRLHTGEVKQRHHTGEVKQRLHTGEVKQRHHTGEVKQRLHTGEVKQRLHTGEVKQRLQTGEVKQRLQTGEVKQRLHTGEVKQRLHTGEVKQRLHTGEVKQRLHTGEVKQRLHTGEVKQPPHSEKIGPPSAAHPHSDKQTLTAGKPLKKCIIHFKQHPENVGKNENNIIKTPSVVNRPTNTAKGPRSETLQASANKRTRLQTSQISASTDTHSETQRISRRRQCL